MSFIKNAIAASCEAAHASAIAGAKDGTVWKIVRDGWVAAYNAGTLPLGGEQAGDEWKRFETAEFAKGVWEGIEEGLYQEDKVTRETKVGKGKVIRRALWIDINGEQLDPPPSTKGVAEYRKAGHKDMFNKYVSAVSVIKGAVVAGVNPAGMAKDECSKATKGVVDDKKKEESEKIVVPDEILEAARRFVEMCEEDRQMIYTAIAKAMAS